MPKYAWRQQGLPVEPLRERPVAEVRVYADLLKVAGKDTLGLAPVDGFRRVRSSMLAKAKAIYRVGCPAGRAVFAVYVTVFSVCATVFDVIVTFLPD